MSRKELEAFLRRPLVAVLTTVAPDASLHSTPIWFEYRDGKFYFWIGSDSVKARNLGQNPEASGCIATHDEPYQYVSAAAGRCEISTRDIEPVCLSICPALLQRRRGASLRQPGLPHGRLRDLGHDASPADLGARGVKSV